MTLAYARRVLVVDPNEDTSFIITTLLSQSGFEVRVAKTASEAQELATSQHFDAFVVDQDLPDVSGFEVCRRLARLHHLAPVIFHAGDSLGVHCDLAMKCGASAYLTKPLGMFQLVPKLRRLLKSLADAQLCS